MQYVLKEMRKIGVPEGIEFKTDNSVHWLLDIIEDAVRYRWLREQHWDSSPLCVVKDPKFALRLGAHCPSGYNLDNTIDEEM